VHLQHFWMNRRERLETPLTPCVENRLPPKLSRIARKEAIAENPANGFPLEGAADRPLLWKPKRILRITFLDGHSSVQQKVIFYAMKWCRHANIFFNFGSDPNAEIRITFTNGESSSFVGMEASKVPQQLPTMKLGLSLSSPEEVFSHVVLHEFGHVLGLIHEHQNPIGGIQWNKKAVFEELTASPYEWTTEQIEINIFESLSIPQIQFTSFDPWSIMLYPIPARWTLDGFSSNWNYTLSETDKMFVHTLYPK
jgi:serralysin